MTPGIPDRIVTYVTYLYPGTFFSEEDGREVAGRDPQRTARDAAPGVFAFSFHDIAVSTVTVDGREVELRSGPIRKSPMYFIDAERLGVADVEELAGDNRILLSNMRCNGWGTVLRCRTGNFQPEGPSDIVISSRRRAS
jgi:hypothetical protein